MRVPIDACCVGGPAQEQSPVSAVALLVIAAIYRAGALLVLAITASVL